jgi:hypothetical protein
MFKVCGAAAEPFGHTKAVVLQVKLFPLEFGPSPNRSGHTCAGDVMDSRPARLSCHLARVAQNCDTMTV